MCTQKRTNIWKIVSKNVKQQETKPTHTYYNITPRDKTNTHKNAIVFKLRLKT